MKKTLFAAIALPLACAIFFSCESTEGAATKAEAVSLVDAQESPAQEQSEQNVGEQEIAGEPAAETSEAPETAEQPEAAETAEASETVEAAEQEEKISESEMKEFTSLMDEGASESGNGSLVEKIKESNKERAESKDQSGAKDTDLARVTNKGNTIEGGPLIGPSSNKIPGSEKTAGSNASTTKNAEPNKSAANNAGARGNSTAANSSANTDKTENNEAISLTAPQKEQEEEPKEEKPEPVPSRSMTVKNNQFVDVVYPGSGWIYLGEEGAGDHFIFQGRKLGNAETTFTLRSKKPGTALLHFYKNDILTGNYIDDFIEISITDKSATDATHVEAPSYAEVVPPKFDRTKAVEEKALAQAPKESAPQKEDKAPQSQGAKEKAPTKESEPAEIHAENSPSEKVQTVIQTAGQDKDKGESRQKTSVAGTKAPEAQEDAKESALQEGFSGGTDKAKSLLERAQKAYDEKRYAEALDLVQQFFDTASEDFDAGLYLEGLILEAKSEVRNIKSAIGAYDTLIKNWPQSNYWRKANERSIYLKRFYIDIR
ncbi:MAG: hypothetical protein IK094_10755 [Treponema sp.]|nr:hypothetical protein [Treponema sp.]